MHNLLPAALWILLLGATAGCNITGRPLPELVHEINGTLHQGESILPGDELQVRFPYESDWNQSTIVSAEGSAAFLELDEIVVGGMTLETLDEKLTQGYARILETPDLTVRVRTRAPRTCSIIGEVKSPGVYEIRNHYTLLDLFADAGGHSKTTADLTGLMFLRWIPDIQQVRAWYVDVSKEHWIGHEPLYIQPLDVVYIPNKSIDKVNIWVDQYIRRMLPVPIPIYY